MSKDKENQETTETKKETGNTEIIEVRDLNEVIPLMVNRELLEVMLLKPGSNPVLIAIYKSQEGKIFTTRKASFA